MNGARNFCIQRQGHSKRRSLAGFTLLDTLIILGLGLGLMVAVLENTANTRAQLSQIRSKVRAADFGVQVRTVFAGNTLGGQILRNFNASTSTPRPTTWNQAFPSEEQVQLPRGSASQSRVCPTEGFSNTSSGQSGTKIPVDLVYLPGAPLVKGLPLRADPGSQVEDLFLVQYGTDGACPAEALCTDRNPCPFRLFIQFKGASGGAMANARVQSTIIPLKCSIDPFDSSNDPNYSGRINECWLADLVMPSPTPTATQCIGDINQDGMTDDFDLMLLLRLWGAVPSPLPSSTSSWIAHFKTPEGVDMQWVARGSNGWPAPAPTPSYGPDFYAKWAQLIKKADIHPVGGGDNQVAGDDLGFVLSNMGCKLAPSVARPCFKDTPIFALYDRAAKFSKPENLIDNADRTALEFCARASQATLDQVTWRQICASRNLDFKCAKRGTAIPTSGSYNYCRRVGSLTPEPDFHVVTQSDLDVLDFLRVIQATLSRFKQDCGSSQTSGTYSSGGWNPNATANMSVYDKNLSPSLSTGLDSDLGFQSGSQSGSQGLQGGQ